MLLRLLYGISNTGTDIHVKIVILVLTSNTELVPTLLQPRQKSIAKDTGVTGECIFDRHMYLQVYNTPMFSAYSQPSGSFRCSI